MGVGPNYVLDKGYRATGVTAYKRGEIVVPTNTGLDIARAITASTLAPYYVNMEDIDAGRVATGKAILDTRMLGIARVLSGAAVAVWSRIVPDATARGIAATRTAGGSQPAIVLGIALTGASAAGQEIDVLVQPGLTW